MKAEVTPMRAVIVGTLVLCLGVAMAPWLSGGQEPVGRLVSAGALLLAAVLAWLQPEVLRLKWGPLVGSWVVLVGWATLSLLWSANRYSSAVCVADWVMAGLAFKVAYTVAGEQRGREWLIRLYLVSAGIFSLAAVWMFLTATYPRLTGAFYWPNPAAAYMLPAILITLERLRRARGRRMVVAWTGASAGLVATFLLTDSRAALLVLLLAVVIYLLITDLKRYWIKFLCAVVAALALSIGLAQLSTVTAHHSWSLIPGSRLAQVAGGEPTSLRDRVDYVSSGFAMWWSHPLLGVGAGTYGDVHPQYQQRVESASTNAHNLYVQTLAELGLVGAVALAAVLLWLLVGSVRGLVLHPELTAVALGLGALLVHFGLDIDASYPALLMLAAVLAGMLYVQWWPARRRAGWWWPAAALAVLVPVVSLYQSDEWAAHGAAAQNNADYSLAAADYAAAHRGIAYNPDTVEAEGIDWYALAAFSGGKTRAVNAAKAVGLAREAQKLDPHDGQHHQLEGRILALEGNLKASEGALSMALKLDPYNHPQYTLDLATVQIEAEQPAAAERTAARMLALYPPKVVANRNFDATIKPTLQRLRAVEAEAKALTQVDNR